MGYVARSVTAPTIAKEVAIVNGINLFSGVSTRMSSTTTIYKASIDFTDIDSAIFNGMVKCNSGNNTKYLKFYIGGNLKLTIEATGETWVEASRNDQKIDCSSITGDNDVEITAVDETTNDLELKNISMSFCIA